MNVNTQWQCLTFDELSTQQLYQILKLRTDVFVVEQNCPYLETDDKDLAHCWHLFTLDQSTNAVIAYCRIISPSVVYTGAAIGRVVVEKKMRGEGYGLALMNQAIAFCQQRWPETDIELSAQCQWEGFYQTLGFNVEGDVYLEDNIPHIHMIRPG